MATRKRGAAKMGRPPGPPGSARTHRVVVLLNDGEHAQLERLAADQGVTLGNAVYRIVSRALGRARRR
jgi:hypothetical protein